MRIAAELLIPDREGQLSDAVRFKSKRDVDVIRNSINDKTSRSDFLNPVGKDLTVVENVELDKKNKKSTVTLSFSRNAFMDIS